MAIIESLACGALGNSAATPLPTGQTNVRAYNRKLRDLIATGRAKLSFIVSHELPLSRAPGAYMHFDKRDESWTKVVLKPGT